MKELNQLKNKTKNYSYQDYQEMISQTQPSLPPLKPLGITNQNLTKNKNQAKPQEPKKSLKKQIPKIKPTQTNPSQNKEDKENQIPNITHTYTTHTSTTIIPLLPKKPSNPQNPPNPPNLKNRENPEEESKSRSISTLPPHIPQACSKSGSLHQDSKSSIWEAIDTESSALGLDTRIALAEINTTPTSYSFSNQPQGVYPVSRLVLSPLSFYTVQNHGYDILAKIHSAQHLHKAVCCLEKHSVGESVRARMVNWMIEVLVVFKSKRNTFFLAVALMDSFFSLAEISYSDEDIHLIGVVCMLLASKLEDKYPIQIKCIHEQVVFRQFTIWQIMEMERQICKTLDFKLNIATPQEFIQMYVAQLKYYFTEEFAPDDFYLIEELENGALLLCMLRCFRSNFLSNDLSTLAAGSLFAFYLAFKEGSIDFKTNLDIDLNLLKEKLYKWLSALAGTEVNSKGENENFIQMEKSAQKLLKFKNKFSQKYPDFTNPFNYKFRK